MKTFRFIEFPVYQLSKELFHQTVIDSRKFPREHWELADQLRRSALSVSLNIAEGSAKASDKDFNRYLQNALGSINEVVACIDIAFSELLLTQEQVKIYFERSETITKQLGGFSKVLRSKR